MQNISFLKRAIYNYLGIMLWFIHRSDTQRILGLRISSLIKVSTLMLPVALWIARWEREVVVLAILIFLWIQLSYWRAHRTGYYRFVAADTELMATEELTPLPKKKHVILCASGTFSLKDWEKNLVLRPAQYWQVPLGDHAIMVEHEPGRYLYQFFNAVTMQELRCGWLLYGSRPRPAIAVTFLSSWGPEFNEDNVSFLRKDNNSPPKKIRTVYMSFESNEQEQAVWHNLVFDARRVRS